MERKSQKAKETCQRSQLRRGRVKVWILNPLLFLLAPAGSEWKAWRRNKLPVHPMGEDQDLESAQSLLLIPTLTSGHPNCSRFEVALGVLLWRDLLCSEWPSEVNHMGLKVGQAPWSPSSGVIVQTGQPESQWGTGLARPGDLHITFLSSALSKEEGTRKLGSWSQVQHSD